MALILLLTPYVGMAQADLTDLEPGIQLYKNREYQPAKAFLEAAVKKRKRDPVAWHFLGLVLEAVDDTSGAKKAHEKAAKLGEDLLVAQLKELTSSDRLERIERGEGTVSGTKAPVAGRMEPIDAMQGRFIEAAGALERFLQLEPNAKNKETWLTQLESLRFHATPKDKRSEAEQVYSGKEVTTKARVTAKPEPRYTQQARNQQTTGTVVLRCVFAADGTVKYLVVVEGLPDG